MKNGEGSSSSERWSLLLVWITGASLFLVLEFANRYLTSGFDGYYHLKLPVIIAEQGWMPKEFPWLQGTIFRDHYVNHHYFYHFLLVPLAILFSGDNLLVAGKIFTALVVGSAFIPTYLIARRRLSPGGALICTMATAFLLPSVTYNRLVMIRTYTVALPLFLWGVLFILQNRARAVGILSCILFLMYGGFFVFPAIVSLYLVSQLIVGERPAYRLFLASLAGLAAGVILHPNGASLVQFLIFHLSEAAFRSPVPVGSEWRPFSTWAWTRISLAGLSLAASVYILVLRFGIKIERDGLFLILVTLFWTGASLVSNRFLEYQPFFLFLAVYYPLPDLAPHFSKLRRMLVYRFAAVILLLFLGWRSVVELKASYDKGGQVTWNMDDIKAGMRWLKENSAQGDIVFTASWDFFPVLFFQNHWNYYIAGMDPNYMYRLSPELYRRYDNITNGRSSADMKDVKDVFHARWAIATSTRHSAVLANFKKYPSLFKPRYEGKTLTIFEVIG